MRNEHVNGLATASLIFGILAILCAVAVLPTPFTAGLAITFAWLSRGDGKMCARASAGNILGVVSIIISIAAAVALVIAGIHYAKQFLQQIRIAKDIMHSRSVSSEIKGLVKGLMVESYIEDGCQKIGIYTGVCACL